MLLVRWLLFAHVTGVALWLGGVVALLVLQRKSKAMVADADVMSADARQLLLGTIGAVVRWILTPSAALVLFTGPVMLMQMGLIGMSKPFWLDFMERFGGVVALVSMVLLTWQMRNAERATATVDQNRHLHRLSVTLTGVGVATLATVFVVVLRM